MKTFTGGPVPQEDGFLREKWELLTPS